MLEIHERKLQDYYLDVKLNKYILNLNSDGGRFEVYKG